MARRGRAGWALGVAALALSMGTYQAYAAVAISLALLLGWSLVLTGRSLAAIFAWADCLDFFKTAVQFDSVLCCRVTPKQKVSDFWNSKNRRKSCGGCRRRAVT